jgi:adenosylcobinamide-phosphate guanylyltransferase
MVTAIVMAGGKGTRMGKSSEKPLKKVFGIPMIIRVIDALSDSKQISEILVATSPNTPKTAELIHEIGVNVINTPGNGYVEDLQYIISKKYNNTPNEILLTITSDMPLIKGETIDTVLLNYQSCNKPAMCIAVPLDFFLENSLKPSIVYGDSVPSGLNILRSNNKQQDEEVLMLRKIELAVNINSCEDIVVLEEVLNKIGIKI